MYVYFINDFYQENKISIDFQNRSFRYGDGLFETIRAFNGKIPFLSFHLARLYKGLEVLKINIKLEAEQIEAILLELLVKNKLKNARIRLMVFRKGEGLYLPNASEGGLFIEVKLIEDRKFVLNEKGKSLEVFKDIPKVASSISFLKTNNGLPYIMAAQFANANGFDTCVLLNEREQLADTIYSNIFMIKEGYFFTPPLSDGGVGGTMRGIVQQIIAQEGWELFENSLSEKDLLAADEVFLTNAIRGVQWVGKFRTKTYTCDFTQKVFEKLNGLLTA